MRILQVVFFAIIIVPAVVFGMLIFVLGGGPKVLSPPNQYSLKMTVNMTIDGQAMSHVGGVRCAVKDQRGSIAVGDWIIDHEYGQPFFMRTGGGAVVLSHIDPCKWRETSPQPGEVYEMDLLGDLYDELGADWGDMGFWGEINILDDATRPKTVRSIPLAHADDKTIWGVRADSITLEVSDAEVDTRLLEMVPAVAARTEFTIIQAAVDIYEEVEECTRSSSEGWMVLPANHTCGSSRGRFLPVVVSPDYHRIEIGSLTAPMKDPDFGIARALLSASGKGETSSNGRSFVWLPQVCIEGQCFTTAERDKAGWVAKLANPKSNLIVTLSYETMSAASWVDD